MRSDRHETDSIPTPERIWSLACGERLGPYSLIEEMYRGGMGVIWLAENTETTDRCVLKFLPPERRTQPEAIAEFLRSAELMYGVSHPAICPVEVFLEDHRFGPYCVMPFIDGISFRQLLQERRNLKPNDLTVFLRPVAQALDFAHSKGLIHCDIKPENLMVEQANGRVRIIDFGLVYVEHNLGLQGQLPVMRGTPGYQAPELLKGVVPSPLSDQYSLGIVMWELLTGSRDWRGECPPQWMPFFSRILSIDPEFRFPNCNAAIDEFSRLNEMVTRIKREQLRRSPISVNFRGECCEASLQSPLVSEVDQLIQDHFCRVPAADFLKSAETTRQQLLHELERTDSETQRLRRPLRLGLLGARNSGKSSMLAAWYLFRNDQGLQIDLSPDEATLQYLSEVSAFLLNAGSTQATASQPMVLRFRMAYAGQTALIETMDFSGELLEPLARQNVEFTSDTHEFLRSCDMMICLCDPADRTVSLIDAVDFVFSKKVPTFLLVIPKFDQTQFENISFDEFQLSDFERYFSTLVEENRALGSLFRKLKLSYSEEDVAVIPVSSLGLDPLTLPISQSNPLSSSDLRPFQLFLPLIRALEKRQRYQVRCEHQRQSLARALELLDSHCRLTETELANERERQGREIAERQTREQQVRDKLSDLEHRLDLLLQVPKTQPARFHELLAETDQLLEKARLAGIQQLAGEIADYRQRLLNAGQHPTRARLQREAGGLQSRVQTADWLTFMLLGMTFSNELGSLADQLSRCDAIELARECRLLADGVRIKWFAVMVILVVLGIISLGLVGEGISRL